MRDMNLHLLQCLDMLMREGNVSRAAQRLKISQPAMSMALKKLREMFDDPLVVRTRAGLKPTERALALHPQIKSLISEMQSVLTFSNDFDPRSARRAFTLILTDYVDVLLMPRLIPALKATGADITLNVVGPNPLHIGGLFSQGTVDLTVSYFPKAPPNLLSRTVFSDRMVCLARSGHPALGAELSIEEFCELDHINIEPGEATMYRAVIDDALRAVGCERNVVLSKPEFLGVPFIIERTDFVAILPSRLASMFAERFGLSTFEPPHDIGQIEIRMMWHESTHQSSPHQWLRDQVTAVCRQLPDYHPRIADSG